MKGPGLFSDIGKKAKDLLTKDYNYDPKVTILNRGETVENAMISSSLELATLKQKEADERVSKLLEEQKLEVQFLRDYLVASNVAAFKKSRGLDLAAIGAKGLAFGFKTNIDTATGTVSELKFGVGFQKPKHDVSLFYDDTLQASYAYILDDSDKKQTSFVATEIIG